MLRKSQAFADREHRCVRLEHVADDFGHPFFAADGHKSTEQFGPDAVALEAVTYEQRELGLPATSRPHEVSDSENAPVVSGRRFRDECDLPPVVDEARAREPRVRDTSLEPLDVRETHVYGVVGQRTVKLADE